MCVSAFYLFTSLSIYLLACLSICLSVYLLSVCMSISKIWSHGKPRFNLGNQFCYYHYLYIYISIYLFIYLFIDKLSLYHNMVMRVYLPHNLFLHFYKFYYSFLVVLQNFKLHLDPHINFGKTEI